MLLHDAKRNGDIHTRIDFMTDGPMNRLKNNSTQWFHASYNWVRSFHHKHVPEMYKSQQMAKIRWYYYNELGYWIPKSRPIFLWLDGNTVYYRKSMAPIIILADQGICSPLAFGGDITIFNLQLPHYANYFILIHLIMRVQEDSLKCMSWIRCICQWVRH